MFSFLTFARYASCSTDTYEMVTEKDNGKLEMNVSYHFASTLRSAVTSGDPGSAARARRLAQEISSLASSLPLSYSSSVFVRCDEERLDIMKVTTTTNLNRT